VAIQALSFLAAEPERIGRFLSLTGLTPESLRDAASHPNFLLGVLDHLAGDEALLRAFAEDMDNDPAMIAAARDTLAGAPPAAG
jgi:hypothetical protein